MAIDISYYFQCALDRKTNELFSKYFSKNNFKSLYSASNFFSSLKEEDLRWLKNPKSVSSILQKSPLVAEALKSQECSLQTLLEEEIYPRIDVQDLLSDLSPKVTAHNTTLECPCCGKKEAFIGGKGKGQVIICNRQNKCGEKTTFIDHIKNREGLSFYQAVNFIADNAGIDLQSLKQSREIQKGDNKENNFLKERTFHQREQRIKDWIEEINFERLDADKKFVSINTRQYIDKFSKLNLNKKQKYQVVLSYIRDFASSNRDNNSVSDFFATRGLPIHSLTMDVGFIAKDKIPKLVKNLEEIFGKNELINLSILSKNGYWKHGAIDKDTGKFKYCDAILFNMHDPYSDVPTNLEFRFIGDGSKNIKNKTSAIENSDIVKPNYYGMNYNIDSLKSKSIWWFQEGAIDAKTITALGYNAMSLIGVHKHFSEKIGYFQGKVGVICFDQDKAGYDNTQKFAEKLIMAGAKQVVVATWNQKYGKDVNDLLTSDNLDKIKFSNLIRSEEVSNGYRIPIYSYSTVTQDIDTDSLDLALGKIYEAQNKYSISAKTDSSLEIQQSKQKEVQIEEKISGTLGLEKFISN